MLKLNNIAKKAITTVIATTMLALNINISAVIAESDPDEIPLQPTENQYLEMRATSIKEVTGQDKQVIFKLIGHNLDFKGFDVRFSYDGTIFKTSNIETNVPTDDEKEFCKLESEFSSCTEFFTVEYTGEGTGIRGVFSFNPPVNETEHIKEKDGIGKVITTNEELLIGEFSFSMKSDEFDISSFKLETGTNFPMTGIDINLDGTHCFEEQTVFRFTDKTASKDAYLSKLIVSSGIKDEENPANSTYKEYELVPIFDMKTLKYELTLMEYIDTLNIKLTQNDPKSTVEIEMPMRDVDNKLQYETDGKIKYDKKTLQKDTQNNINEQVTINKLGEPDTIITITVTAEDGKTINNYELTIKRPCGLIKGKVVTTPTTSTTGKHEATVRIYKTEDANNAIDWSSIKPGISDNVHETLLTLNSLNVETNDDGTYEIYVIPGTYNILLDKTGYLDQIITSKQINSGETIELGEKTLLPRRYK